MSAEDLPIKQEQAGEVELASKFSEFEQQAQEWKEKAFAIKVTSKDQVDVIQQAKDGRKLIAGIRIQVEKKRVELKDRALKEGQMIDKAAKKIKDLIEPIETHLKEQEDYVERLEAEERKSLQRARLEALAPYRRPGDGLDSINYYDMHPDVWNAFLLGQGAAHEQREAQAKTQQEEKERREKEHAEEQERIKQENQRLKEEKERQEEKNRRLRARINSVNAAGLKWSEANQRYQHSDDERTEFMTLTMEQVNDFADDIFTTTLEAIAKEVGRREKISKAAKEKRDAELKELREKEERERKEKAEKDAAEKRLRRAPDKEKLLSFSEKIMLLEAPELKDESAKAIMFQVQGLLLKVRNYINDQIKNL